MLRVAYTLEQCWHDVPGGTATATLNVARRLDRRQDVDLIGVAGRHRDEPDTPFRPPRAPVSLPVARPWLYEAWNRFERPRVEGVTGPIDVCHSTTAIPAATRAPHVVTVHDVAFVHHPERFTRHGARVMRRGLERCRDADLVLCPTEVTATELIELGFDRGRLRTIPWGVEAGVVDDADRERVRLAHQLPDDFVLFVGTVEPRKNLRSLADAVGRTASNLPLVIAGAPGWGDGVADGGRFLGYVPPDDLPALFDLASVFAYPSLHEGFGLPVLEAMAQGTPVVTSRGTATEEAAGGAAVLVDPADVSSIAAGIDAALGRRDELVAAGRRRAAECSWDTTVELTVSAYREIAR